MITHLADTMAVAAMLVGNGFLTVASILAWSSRVDCRSRDLSTVTEPLAAPGAAPSIAIIRPLYGPDASGGSNNAALMRQRYAGELAFTFVASRARDPGLLAARAAHAGDPRVTFIVSEESDDATDKASGMIAGWRATSAPFIAFCDADVHLDPDTIARCLALFDADDVAGVFAPALHMPATGLQRLVATINSGDKVVTVRALDRMGHLRLMEGGLMVVRRSALDAVGSIDVLRETIADDLRLASVLTAAGYRLRAGPVIRHAQDAGNLVSLARQYHRWMLCQRVESPLAAGCAVESSRDRPAPLRMGASSVNRLPLIVLGTSVLWRVALTAVIERIHLRPHGLRLGWWVLARPLADLVHVAACAAAFLVPTVRWGESHLPLRAPPPARSHPHHRGPLSAMTPADVRVP